MVDLQSAWFNSQPAQCLCDPRWPEVLLWCEPRETSRPHQVQHALVPMTKQWKPSAPLKWHDRANSCERCASGGIGILYKVPLLDASLILAGTQSSQERRGRKIWSHPAWASGTQKCPDPLLLQLNNIQYVWSTGCFKQSSQQQVCKSNSFAPHRQSWIWCVQNMRVQFRLFSTAWWDLSGLFNGISWCLDWKRRWMWSHQTLTLINNKIVSNMDPNRV